MNRYGAAAIAQRVPQAGMRDLDWDDDAFELSRVRSVRSAGLASASPRYDADAIDFPESFSRPYREEVVEFEEDPAIAESWHARRWRRRAVKTAGWLSIMAMLVGVFGLTRSESFRDEVARFVTLRQVDELPRSVHGMITAAQSRVR